MKGQFYEVGEAVPGDWFWVTPRPDRGPFRQGRLTFARPCVDQGLHDDGSRVVYALAGGHDPAFEGDGWANADLTFEPKVRLIGLCDHMPPCAGGYDGKPPR